MNNALLEALNISKLYNRKVILNNINLKIYEGEIVLIYGKSGAGKTTLLRILSLIDRSYQGKLVYSFNLKNYDEIRLKQIGYIPQFGDLISSLTIEENISLPMEMIGFKKEKVKSKVHEIAKFLEIEHILNKYPSDVSGGEMQRASIARAIVKNPKIIIADEPTSHLDDSMENKVLTMLENFSKQGVTVIVTSTNKNYPINANSVYKLETGTLMKDEN